MTNVFIKETGGVRRELNWSELNRLKKDILWNFDENGEDLFNSFLPQHDFELFYWEYVNLEGDIAETNFYRIGALILVLSKIAEYIDIPGGNQNAFNQTPISAIELHIERFRPMNSAEGQLKELALLGLLIARAISQEDISKNDVFDHESMNAFAVRLRWIQEAFILPYYRSRCK